MSDEIKGAINEVRGRFDGDGLTGKVWFNRSYKQGSHEVTTVSVDLSDGRKAYGKYKTPKEVLLHTYKLKRWHRSRQ